MICPILSEPDVLMDCLKNECKWRTQGNCIVFDFNSSLKDLNAEVYKGFKSLVDHSYHRRYAT